MRPAKPPKTQSPFFKAVVYILLVTFNLTPLAPLASLNAQEMPLLPTPGIMVHLSQTMTPPILKGIQIYPDNPLKFGFIIDRGTVELSDPERQKETLKMAKYFLTSLAIPEKDMWVNLSPYESDRMVDEDVGQTELGRDMLAQDYLLKQITASLMYPQEELGKDFWDKVYKKVYEQFGTTKMPVNTFNKVWIVTDRAEVYENKNTAFVIDHHLKVMLEEDYLALEKNLSPSLTLPTKGEGSQGAAIDINSPPLVGGDRGGKNLSEKKVRYLSSVASQIVREVIIPALEKEVNEGENFAAIRQIYNAHILAVWYKKSLKESLLGRVYANQNKIQGVDLEDKTVKEKIYNQYIEAFQKGAVNLIKEDYDENTKTHIKRRYFSGGVTLPDLAAIDFVDDADLRVTPRLSDKFRKATTIPNFDFADVEASELNEPDAASITPKTDLAAIKTIAEAKGIILIPPKVQYPGGKSVAEYLSSQDPDRIALVFGWEPNENVIKELRAVSPSVSQLIAADLTGGDSSWAIKDGISGAFTAGAHFALISEDDVTVLPWNPSDDIKERIIVEVKLRELMELKSKVEKLVSSGFTAFSFKVNEFNVEIFKPMIAIFGAAKNVTVFINGDRAMLMANKKSNVPNLETPRGKIFAAQAVVGIDAALHVAQGAEGLYKVCSLEMKRGPVVLDVTNVEGTSVAGVSLLNVGEAIAQLRSDNSDTMIAVRSAKEEVAEQLIQSGANMIFVPGSDFSVKFISSLKANSATQGVVVIADNIQDAALRSQLINAGVNGFLVGGANQKEDTVQYLLELQAIEEIRNSPQGSDLIILGTSGLSALTGQSSDQLIAGDIVDGVYVPQSGSDKETNLIRKAKRGSVGEGDSLLKSVFNPADPLSFRNGDDAMLMTTKGAFDLSSSSPPVETDSKVFYSNIALVAYSNDSSEVEIIAAIDEALTSGKFVVVVEGRQHTAAMLSKFGQTKKIVMRLTSIPSAETPDGILERINSAVREGARAVSITYKQYETVFKAGKVLSPLPVIVRLDALRGVEQYKQPRAINGEAQKAIDAGIKIISLDIKDGGGWDQTFQAREEIIQEFKKFAMTKPAVQFILNGEVVDNAMLTANKKSNQPRSTPETIESLTRYKVAGEIDIYEFLRQRLRGENLWTTIINLGNRILKNKSMLVIDASGREDSIITGDQIANYTNDMYRDEDSYVIVRLGDSLLNRNFMGLDEGWKYLKAGVEVFIGSYQAFISSRDIFLRDQNDLKKIGRENYGVVPQFVVHVSDYEEARNALTWETADGIEASVELWEQIVRDHPGFLQESAGKIKLVSDVSNDSQSRAQNLIKDGTVHAGILGVNVESESGFQSGLEKLSQFKDNAAVTTAQENDLPGVTPKAANDTASIAPFTHTVDHKSASDRPEIFNVKEMTLLKDIWTLGAKINDFLKNSIQIPILNFQGVTIVQTVYLFSDVMNGLMKKRNTVRFLRRLDTYKQTQLMIKFDPDNKVR